MTGEMFFKQLATIRVDSPPYPADTAQIERLKKLGVEPGKDFDAAKIDPAIRKGINAAPPEVWTKFATGPFAMCCSRTAGSICRP